MTSIIIKKGEGKWIQFTLTRNGLAIDLSTATFRFVVKNTYESIEYIIEKEDTDFDKSEAVDGIVKVNLSSTDTDISPKSYIAELETIIVDSTDVDKSKTFTFVIEKSVFHD